MASGTPVVATKVWGTPEVVTTDDAGILVDRTVESIGKGIRSLLANAPQRVATRKYAEQFDWQSTSQGQFNIFNKTIKEDV
jgi:glycosyltransferase involved in cell wall biosynthesis